MSNAKSYLEIDLDQFCGNDRPFATRPFSLNGHTYATNGHILVRVPLIESVEPPEGASEGFEARLNEVLAGVEAAAYFDLPVDKLPPTAADMDCPACGGNGRKHNCPKCPCKCEHCSGTGRVATHNFIAINRQPFCEGYVRMIATLPNPRMAAPRPPKRGSDPGPTFFRFGNNGFGALMPLQHPGDGERVADIKLGNRD